MSDVFDFTPVRAPTGDGAAAATVASEWKYVPVRRTAAPAAEGEAEDAPEIPGLGPVPGAETFGGDLG